MRESEIDIASERASQINLSAAAMLTAGMAHEINNALLALVTHLSILSDLLEPRAAGNCNDEARSELTAAQDAAQHIVAVVRDVLALMRSERRTSNIDPRCAIERALRLAGPHADGAAVLRADLEPVPDVVASEASLTQVALNLVLNAIDACRAAAPRSGHIDIRLYRDGGAIALDVRDDGKGIEPELVQKIFEPMVSTKLGTCSGLGLAITSQLVSGMGGTIHVDSRPGSGTSFRVKLPVASDLP